ncbi:hypothetical protein D3C81_2339340 [compost metagenome]
MQAKLAVRNIAAGNTCQWLVVGTLAGQVDIAADDAKRTDSVQHGGRPFQYINTLIEFRRDATTLCHPV